MGGLIAKITTQQIKNPERCKRLQRVLQKALLIRQLAHPLLQLNSID